MSGFNDSRDSGYNSFNSYSDPGCSKKPDNAVSSHSSRKEESDPSSSSSYAYNVYRVDDESSDDDWRPAGGSGGSGGYVEQFPYQDLFKGVSLVKSDKEKEEEERKRKEEKTLSPEELQKQEESIKKAKEERKLLHERLSAYNDYFDALLTNLTSLEVSKEPSQNLEDMREIVAALKYIKEVVNGTKKYSVDEIRQVWRYQAQLASQRHRRTTELEKNVREIALKLEKDQEKLEKAANFGQIFIENSIKRHKKKIDKLDQELKENVATLGDRLKFDVFSGDYLSQSTPQEVLPELIDGVVQKYWARLHTKELMAGYIEKKIEDKIDRNTRHLAPSGFSSGPSTSRQTEQKDEAASKLKKDQNEKCEETAQEQPASSQDDVAPIENVEGVAQDVPSQDEAVPGHYELASIENSEKITRNEAAPSQNQQAEDGPAPAHGQDVPSQNVHTPAQDEAASGHDEPVIIGNVEGVAQEVHCQNGPAPAQNEAAPYQNQPALIENVPQNLSTPCQNDSGLTRYDAPAAQDQQASIGNSEKVVQNENAPGRDKLAPIENKKAAQNQDPPCESDPALAQNANATSKVGPAAIKSIEKIGKNGSATAQSEAGPIHKRQAPVENIVEVPQNATAPSYDEPTIVDAKVDTIVEEISVEFETKVSVKAEEEIEQSRARESDEEDVVQPGPSSQLTPNSPATTQTTVSQPTGKITKRTASPKASAPKRAKTGNVQAKRKAGKKAAGSPDIEVQPAKLEDMDDLSIAYVAIGSNFYGEDGSKLAGSQKLDLEKVDQVAFGTFTRPENFKEKDIVEELLRRSKSSKDAAPSTASSKDTAGPSTSASKDAAPSTSAATSKKSSKSPQKETSTQVVIFYKYPEQQFGDWQPYEATRVSQWMTNILQQEGIASKLDAIKLRNETKFSEAVKDGSLCRALLSTLSKDKNLTIEDWGSDGPTEEQAKDFVGYIKTIVEKRGVKMAIEPQDIIDGNSKKMLKFACDMWVEREAFGIRNLLSPEFDFTQDERDKGKEKLKEMVDSFKNCLPKDQEIREDYYDYFLIDKNLLKKNGDEYTLEEFCNAIFYVGKGTGARSEGHFKEARDPEEEEEKKEKQEIKEKGVKISRKIGTIQKGWENGQRNTGYFRFAENSSNLKSLIVEASIIDYLGTDELSNKKKGDWKHVINSVLGGDRLEKGESIQADPSKKEARQIAAYVLQEALDKFNKEQDIVCPEKKP